MPWWWWLMGAAFVGTLWFVGWAALTVSFATMLAAVGAVVVIATLWALGSTRLVVDDQGLHFGRAVLQRPWMGAAEPLGARQTRAVIRGTEGPRTHLAYRSHLAESVLVLVEDDADPVQRWLVSTRHPQRLAAVLNDLTGSQLPEPGQAPDALDQDVAQASLLAADVAPSSADEPEQQEVDEPDANQHEHGDGRDTAAQPDADHEEPTRDH